MRQDQALQVMRQGRSVFLTGPAGSGKTYILNKFIAQLKKQKKQIAITASTGIAATHLGGITIHSWSGLGIRDELTDKDSSWLANNSRLVKRYNTTDVLVIDEISMLHGRRLGMINEVCKLLRQSNEPFGGLQLILTGDLFQLPPVNKSEEPDDFVHLSAAWQELNPAICYLGEQHRQKNGDLLRVLQAMRANDLRRSHLIHLQNRLGLAPSKDLILTRLFAHNVDVETINQEQLKKLKGKSHIYETVTSGRKTAIEQLQKSVLAPERLELKIDAEVMFVANNFAEGYANGTRGKVIGFEDDNDLPIVQLQSNKRRITVEAYTWSREEDGKVRARVTQLPLRLAWAMTIHKSQGMSLDSALIDLSQAFTYGMGYVALSRVRSLEGLYLSGLSAMALKLHPDIYDLDRVLQNASQKLAEDIGDVIVKAPGEVKLVQDDFDSSLFEVLRSWRAERAASGSMPAYIIAHDKTLQDIARRQPITDPQLLAVNGFGPKKLVAYGPDILAIVRAHKS